MKIPKFLKNFLLTMTLTNPQGIAFTLTDNSTYINERQGKKKYLLIVDTKGRRDYVTIPMSSQWSGKKPEQPRSADNPEALAAPVPHHEKY